MLNQQTTCCLSLGSNLGDRLYHISTSIDMISQSIGIIQKVSNTYTAASWGFYGKEFLNLCLIVSTFKSPIEVLKKIVLIEKQLGRERSLSKRYENRVIDIDIIFYEQMIIQEKDLTVPHPKMHLRKFILEPLNEIAGTWQHPIFKTNVKSLLENCKDNTPLNLFAKKVPKDDPNTYGHV